jgi:hypothetical protein
VPDGIEFCRSTVVLVDRVTADAASVPREFGPASLSREYPADRKGLAGALGFAAAYPAGILRAPRTSIEDLLECLSGLRMLTFHEARDWGPDPDWADDAHVTRGAGEAP